MALSNKFGWMLLTTGNKSEMSVGYATLYGDMCGGFSVLKDIYKTDVYRLSRWRNADRPPAAVGPLGPAGDVIPERTLTRAPTAELRPNQTDQDSLPPYDQLDAILRGLIEQEQAVDALVTEGFSNSDVSVLMSDNQGSKDFAHEKNTKAPEGTTTGALSGSISWIAGSIAIGAAASTAGSTSTAVSISTAGSTSAGKTS